MVPPPLHANFAAHPAAFYVHIGSASLALAVGVWQFWPRLRRARTGLHRVLGCIYALACGVGGTAALAIAPGSAGGPVAAAGFIGLALLWLTTTGMAVRAILRKDLVAHRLWMFRSFALTLAGVTLRLYLPIAIFGPFGFGPAYAVIAWLCWAPNLWVAEVLARSRPRARPGPTPGLTRRAAT